MTFESRLVSTTSIARASLTGDGEMQGDSGEAGGHRGSLHGPPLYSLHGPPLYSLHGPPAGAALPRGDSVSRKGFTKVCAWLLLDACCIKHAAWMHAASSMLHQASCSTLLACLTHQAIKHAVCHTHQARRASPHTKRIRYMRSADMYVHAHVHEYARTHKRHTVYRC